MRERKRGEEETGRQRCVREINNRGGEGVDAGKER
jgi:hypothetical protein